MPDLIENTPPGVPPKQYRAAIRERITKKAKEDEAYIKAHEAVVEVRTDLREAKAITLRRKMQVDEAETAYHRALARVDLGEIDDADGERDAYDAARHALEAASRDEAKIHHKLELLRGREEEAFDQASNEMLADLEERARHLIGVCVEVNENFDAAHRAYRHLVDEAQGLGIHLPAPVRHAFFVHGAGPAGKIYKGYAIE